MTSLYVRIRGRVQGPFEMPMLQTMAQRGQLSRIHMVSEDQQDWRKASEYPEVFEPATPLSESSGASDSNKTAGWGVARPTDRPDSLASDGLASDKTVGGVPTEWHVEIDDEPHGPFNFIELQKMFRERNLSPNVQVWREGMTKWVAASTVANLISQTKTKQRSDPREFKSTFSGQIVDRLASGRRWIVAASLLTFAVAVLLALWGFNVIWQGIGHSPALAGLGIVFFLAAIGFSILGFIVMNYTYTLQNAELMRTDENVFASLDEMNRLWKVFVFLFVTLLIAVVVLVLLSLFIFNDTTLFGDLFDGQS